MSNKAAVKAAPTKRAARKAAKKRTTRRAAAKGGAVDLLNIDKLDATVKDGVLYIGGEFVGPKGEVKAAINKLFNRAKRIK